LVPIDARPMSDTPEQRPNFKMRSSEHLDKLFSAKN
jgi:hypothetical protein